MKHLSAPNDQTAEVRQPRNLSGIYFRFKNPVTNKWENWCFEDLPKRKQKEYISGRPEEWKDSMILKLASTIQELGDACNIINNEDHEESQLP